MDVADPEELGHAGAVEICNEAVKILRSYTRHFVAMAGTLVLPLGIFVFSHSVASAPLLHKLTQMRGPNIDAEFVALYVVAMLYLVVVLALSLFATAAIVYSVACVYTGKPLSYMKVIGVVPRVWSRLMNTFLWAHILLAFYYAGFVALLLALLVIQEAIKVSMTFVAVPSGVIFNVFLVHFGLVWHLASVVSVLEDIKGVGAMKRSNALMTGKRMAAFCLFAMYTSSLVVVLGLFGGLAKQDSKHVVGRVFLGVLLLVLWTAATLLGIVIQSVFYFVCRAYHRESIDRSALAEKLDGFLGEYMPLKGSGGSVGALDGELDEV